MTILRYLAEMLVGCIAIFGAPYLIVLYAIAAGVNP